MTIELLTVFVNLVKRGVMCTALIIIIIIRCGV